MKKSYINKKPIWVGFAEEFNLLDTLDEDVIYIIVEKHDE